MNVNPWIDLFDTFGTILLLIVGLMVIAFGGGLWWADRVRRNRASSHHAIPEEWPLTGRCITTNTERGVWLWLRQTFPEYLVLPKLAITRFTMPTSREEAQHWFDILGSVYCTFTICDHRGMVIGCVDIVTGEHDLWRGNRQLKQSLLSQCGMAYWVVTPATLPERAAIRAEFLGDDAPEYLVDSKAIPSAVFPGIALDNPSGARFINSGPTAPMPLTSHFQRAEEQLRETLTDRRRRRRQGAAANDDDGRKPAHAAPATRFENSELAGRDSFLMPLDGDEEQAIDSLLAKRG